ncbi:hypothetical protein RRG08_044577 [Elysia crispata]|uniref:Uncharacterized protein n=1 Tax=Elysia crispata TaxID=231223 RepID=A0AAE0ZTA3_9GAST|nr:hypothetical protein RRG08_044577 [Elysia crispata]
MAVILAQKLPTLLLLCATACNIIQSKPVVKGSGSSGVLKFANSLTMAALYHTIDERATMGTSLLLLCTIIGAALAYPRISAASIEREFGDRPTSIGGQGSNLKSDRQGRSQSRQYNEAAGYHPVPDHQNVGDRPRYEHLRHRLSGHDSGKIPGHVRPAELASGYGFELSERPRIPLGVGHRLGASGGYEAEYAHRDRPVAGPGR